MMDGVDFDYAGFVLSKGIVTNRFTVVHGFLVLLTVKTNPISFRNQLHGGLEISDLHVVYICHMIIRKYFIDIIAEALTVGVFFLINVFLTSGSGQAAAVIPIMAPLADLVGMTRQTAILAFNFGDGFCNYVLPTSTALMGIISAVNIPYDRWMKFMWKLFLIWMAVGSVLLIIAQMIQFGPM